MVKPPNENYPAKLYSIAPVLGVILDITFRQKTPTYERIREPIFISAVDGSVQTASNLLRHEPFYPGSIPCSAKVETYDSKREVSFIATILPNVLQAVLQTS